MWIRGYLALPLGLYDSISIWEWLSRPEARKVQDSYQILKYIYVRMHDGRVGGRVRATDYRVRIPGHCGKVAVYVDANAACVERVIITAPNCSTKLVSCHSIYGCNCPNLAPARYFWYDTFLRQLN